MARLLGILLLVVGLYAFLYWANPNALSGANLLPVARVQGYFGILTLAVSVVIVTGGIDLSIGAVVGLCAVLFGIVVGAGVPPLVAVPLVLVVGAVIGLLHGVLVTGLRLQPFLVTLCGLFAYRGLARYFSGDATVGLSTVIQPDTAAAAQVDWLRWLAVGNVTLGPVTVPVILLLLFLLAAVLGVFLHATVAGRYLFAIGGNEQAARYAGIPVARYKVLAYVLCSTLAALGGVLELLQQPSVAPSSSGTFYELYAITGAVLGGCSLSGGEGNVLGILLGTFVLPILRNMTVWLDGVPDSLQYTIIGVVLLLGTIADEVLKRRANRRG